MTVIQTRPRMLHSGDGDAVRSLVAASPIVNCVLDARLAAAPDLNPRQLGGFVWGLAEAPSGPGAERLRAAAFHGGNLIPVGDDLDALESIAEQLGRGGRGCSSIVGAAPAVAAMWRVLNRFWGEARSIRPDQPLLYTDSPAPIKPDPAVRVVHLHEVAQVVPAAVAMFTEELGISPVGSDGGAGYRQRVTELIADRRTFARFDEHGSVMFKAEIGALSAYTAQLQGVWVRPDLRGRGFGTAATAAALRLALGRAPSVSLYVNHYNSVGRRLYTRLGMRQIETLQTVLF